LEALFSLVRTERTRLARRPVTGFNPLFQLENW
jgi:hypothetical protein